MIAAAVIAAASAAAGSLEVAAPGTHSETRKLSVVARTHSLSSEPMSPPLLDARGGEDPLSAAAESVHRRAGGALCVSSKVRMGAPAGAGRLAAVGHG